MAPDRPERGARGSELAMHWPGLQIPVAEAALLPVPRSMMATLSRSRSTLVQCPRLQTREFGTDGVSVRPAALSDRFRARCQQTPLLSKLASATRLLAEMPISPRIVQHTGHRGAMVVDAQIDRWTRAPF